jgi:hypothetical protein
MNKPIHSATCPLCGTPAEFQFADYENRKNFRCSACMEFQISVRAEVRLKKSPAQWRSALSNLARKHPEDFTLVITIPTGPPADGTVLPTLADEYVENSKLPR